jgi:predicted DNA-binding protein
MPRPAVLKQPKTTVLVLEKELYERLESEAKRRGKSVSALVREIVELYLARGADAETEGSK